MRTALPCNEVMQTHGKLITEKIDTLRRTQGLYSLSGKTSYRQISWSLEAARLDAAMVVSLWNLAGTPAAALPRYLPNFRAIEKFKPEYRGFDTSRDLAVRRLTALWIETLCISHGHPFWKTISSLCHAMYNTNCPETSDMYYRKFFNVISNQQIYWQQIMGMSSLFLNTF